MVAVLQVVHHHVTSGTDVQFSGRVFDRDGHIAVGHDVGQGAADDHVAAHFQRVGRQGHRSELSVRIVWRRDRANRDATAQQQLAGGQHAHGGLGCADQGGDLDRQVGLQAVGIKVLQSGDRGHLGGDDLLAQPATAGFFDISGDFLVCEVTLEALVGFLGRPVDGLARDIDHLDRGLVGGFDDAAREWLGRVGHRLAAAQLLVKFPQRGIAETDHRELQLAARTHVGVEDVGLDVAYQRFVFDQVNRLVAFLLVFDPHGCIKTAAAKRLGNIGRAQHQFRLEQRCAIGETGVS